VWAGNAVQGWMDVMIPPHLVNSTDTLFPSVPYHVVIDDVQQSIDISEQQRAESRSSEDFFSDFQTYGAITNWLAAEAQLKPNLAQRVSIGQTYEGNHIYAMHLGHQNPNRPMFIIQCGIHAREWITPASCCWYIDQILNQDADGDRLLASFQFLIIPVLNVDGYDFTHTSNRLWRKNRQPNVGSTCVGTDLNRNYAYGWSGPGASNNPCAETYYGPSAFSGPETARIRDLIYQHVDENNLASYWDIHAYGSLWMSAWGYTCNSLPTDFPTMQRTMQAAVTACRAPNGHLYDFGSICQTIYQASGSSVDFAYGDGGVLHSYTTEAFGNNFTPPPGYIPMVGQETYLGIKASAFLMTQQKSK